MQKNINWQEFEDNYSLQSEVVKTIINLSSESIKENGVFKVIFSGGSTPEKIYNLLSQDNFINFKKWEIYIGDERCLDSENHDRNSQMIARSLLRELPDDNSPKFFPIESEKGSIQAALSYNKVISKVDYFDLVLLGLGEDGHTASLFPDHNFDTNELVIPVSNAPKPPSDRVSLTPTAFNKGKKIMFIVTGNGKSDAVVKWKTGHDIPASKIRSDNLIDIFINLK